MSDERILEIVKPYLDSNKEMLYSDFDRIFGSLETKKIIYVFKLLEKNGIAVLDDESSDDLSVAACDETCEEEPNSNDDSFKEEEEENFDNYKFDFNNASDEEIADLYQRTNRYYCIDILIEKHIKFIQNSINIVSKQYDHRFDNDELLQIAKLGFMKGCKHFDINKGTKLLTYVKYWIKQELHREITNNGFLIRLPESVWTKIRNITKNNNMNEAEYNKLILYQQKYLNPTSLDENDDYNNDNESFINEISKDAKGFLSKYNDFENVLEKKSLEEFIKTLLNTLTARERDVIILRYGIGENDHARTLEEVGQFYGITRERVRQIELSAKTKMLKKLETQFYSDDEIIKEIKSAIPINFDENYLFKKNNTSYIPALTEMIDRIISLNDEYDNEDELYEQFEICAQQNGYNIQYFNKKEILNKIKQQVDKLQH